VGAGDLPTAINRALKLMCAGEQMRIISPWYAAYGIEGTNSIKPYSNLIILLTIEQ
jgi:FKBP-type peptidyl-prolyl cis-trans isomerase